LRRRKARVSISPSRPRGQEEDAAEHHEADGDVADVADEAQRLGQQGEQDGADDRAGMEPSRRRRPW
jgi:hypothetical protein